MTTLKPFFVNKSINGILTVLPSLIPHIIKFTHYIVCSQMTTRTKEEQQLLDEKIARIQKKNEEILRRRKVSCGCFNNITVLV